MHDEFFFSRGFSSFYVGQFGNPPYGGNGSMQSKGVGHQTFTAIGVESTPAPTGLSSSRGRVGRANKGNAILAESKEQEEKEENHSGESMDEDSDEDSDDPDFAT